MVKVCQHLKILLLFRTFENFVFLLYAVSIISLFVCLGLPKILLFWQLALDQTVLITCLSTVDVSKI